MDPRILQLEYRIQHEHRDGSWGEMAEERAPHDSAQTDPEREWSLRRVFRCTACDEVVTLTPGTEPGSPDAG